MDKILTTPIPTGELKELIEQANQIYQENFDGNVWFGRCIFLSWYCEIGTCKFCFRSTQKHKISHPATARRSLASVLSEAAMIKAFNWRLEFLTGGYGIYEQEDLIRFAKLTKQIIGEDIWLNIGHMDIQSIKDFKPYTQGIVSSIETVNQELHTFVCPDKPIEPYLETIKNAEKLGFKQSMTFIVGLGEKKEHFEELKKFIETYNFDRITIYALRPVANTIYTKGPTPEEVAWWTAKTRIAFPKIEIIVGTAIYRVPEISLIVKAGANAITKLPATKMFNTKDGEEVENQVKLAGRNFISKFTEKDLNSINWEEIISKADLTSEELKELRITLNKYIKSMTHDKKYSKIPDSCDL
ncbi:MAG: radical SAM protein [Candidatus Woesearchaeota archaeon]